MASDNFVMICGNIAGDPELRYTPSGAAVCNFSVAVNRRVKNGDQWEDKLDGFFKCTVWRNMAENVAESLTKGLRVQVTGRLEQRSWEDKDGNKRYEIGIQVDEICPSLKFATADVRKASRSNESGGSWSQPASSGSSSEGW